MSSFGVTKENVLGYEKDMESKECDFKEGEYLVYNEGKLHSRAKSESEACRIVCKTGSGSIFEHVSKQLYLSRIPDTLAKFPVKTEETIEGHLFYRLVKPWHYTMAPESLHCFIGGKFNVEIGLDPIHIEKDTKTGNYPHPDWYKTVPVPVSWVENCIRMVELQDQLNTDLGKDAAGFQLKRIEEDF